MNIKYKYRYIYLQLFVTFNKGLNHKIDNLK